MERPESAVRPAVRPASSDDLPAVRRTLVSGFTADPLYRWLYPDVASRPWLMDEVFRFILSAALPRQAVWLLEDVSAVAVWTPAGIDLLDGGLVDSYGALLVRQIGEARAALAMEGMAAVAHHAPRGPHAMLHTVAVRRDRQGTGAGSALLGRLVAAVPADCPVHLDSSNPRNLSFYGRHGFAAVARTSLPDNGPTMISMQRPPRHATPHAWGTSA